VAGEGPVTVPVVDRFIRPAGPGDARPAAAVFARAFAEDPLYTWIFPDEAVRVRRLPRLFTTQLRAAVRGHDEIDLMVAGGRILGCAVWSPPGASRPTAGQQIAVLAAFPILGRRLPVALGSFGAVSRIRPKEPNWYLIVAAITLFRHRCANDGQRPRLISWFSGRMVVVIVPSFEH
jgi:hypothetical protein